MRLFLGIEIPEETKKYIASYVRPLKRSEKGWEHPHDYHLTLLFIGSVDADTEVESIKRRMEDIRFTPFEIELGPLQFFNRRVLYVGVFPSEKLLQLKKQIEEEFSEHVHPESKPFVPHITVKRWQRYEYNELKKGLDSSSFQSQSVPVWGLTLFKSEKDLENRKYHVIYRRAFED